jgi:pimeloyl-CoA synthetase
VLLYGILQKREIKKNNKKREIFFVFINIKIQKIHNNIKCLQPMIIIVTPNY